MEAISCSNDLGGDSKFAEKFGVSAIEHLDCPSASEHGTLAQIPVRPFQMRPPCKNIWRIRVMRRHHIINVLALQQPRQPIHTSIEHSIEHEQRVPVEFL